MTDNPHFEPIFPSHAIERCTAAIAFTEELPTKAFQRVIDRAQASFRQAGMESFPTSPVGVQVDIQTGIASALSGPRPRIFVTPDRAMQFIVAPSNLTLRTSRYVRWQPFAGQMEELLLPLTTGYVDVVSIAHFQLEYVDRFLWTGGDWSTFSWRELLRADGAFIAGRASQADREWHAHSGWFQYGPRGKRLINVNVDVADFTREEVSFPSISILTLMRDIVPEENSEQGGTYSDIPSIQEGFEELHNESKTLLEQVITTGMAGRIGLTSGSPNAND
jgi:uncharacterized protein (TIGR04255 family)